jgi:hypothetical protein
MAGSLPLAVGVWATGITLVGVIALALAIAAWASLFRDGELPSSAKAIWFFIILIFPIFGSLIYYGVRSDW